jgi:beta-glucosidase-like glycosyl hydrolase
VSESLAALLIPELRWDPDHRFTYLRAAIDDALELGVGGFVIRGGSTAEVQALTAELQRDARRPLLIAAEAERGAGECFRGGTGLPPFAALGALRNEDAIRRAARLTARELRAIGVNWALAPCADLAVVSAENPFLGSRTLSLDPQRVGEWTVAWVDACQAEGVLACAKHLPGVGRAASDPALAPTTIDESGALLWSADLVPFRAVVDTGVATVLVSQVSYPALDRSGIGAARSSIILHDLMRAELQYEGLLVSEPPSQTAARASGNEAEAAVAAIAAGCDLILAPHDVAGVHDAIDAALSGGVLSPDAIDASLARRTFWADWGRSGGGRDATLEEVLWARQVADMVVHATRGVFTNIGPVVDVILVDDDGERAPRGEGERFEPFLATLRAVGLAPRAVEGPTDDGRGAVVIAVRGEPSSGRGRAGYTDATRRRVAQVVAQARTARRSVVAVLFGPPVLAEEIPEVPNVICAWGGDRAMQEAAARRMA